MPREIEPHDPCSCVPYYIIPRHLWERGRDHFADITGMLPPSLLPAVLPHAHVHDRHRVVAENVHHLDRDLSPPRLALVEDAFQFQRAVLLRAEALPLVLEDVIPRPDLFPHLQIRLRRPDARQPPLLVRIQFLGTRTISRLLSKSKSTAQ